MLPENDRPNWMHCIVGDSNLWFLQCILQFGYMHTEINAQCAYCRYSIILVYYTEHRHGDVNIPKVLYHSTTVKNVSFFSFFFRVAWQNSRLGQELCFSLNLYIYWHKGHLLILTFRRPIYCGVQRHLKEYITAEHRHRHRGVNDRGLLLCLHCVELFSRSLSPTGAFSSMSPFHLTKIERCEREKNNCGKRLAYVFLR